MDAKQLIKETAYDATTVGGATAIGIVTAVKGYIDLATSVVAFTAAAIGLYLTIRRLINYNKHKTKKE